MYSLLISCSSISVTTATSGAPAGTRSSKDPNNREIIQMMNNAEHAKIAPS